LYSDGRHPEVASRHYLSKNPSFTFRIETLLEQFPDARFVYIARNPLDVIPSLVSITKFVWTLIGDPVEYESLRHYVFELVREGYDYPVARLRNLEPKRSVMVCFDDLIRDAGETVAGIYRRFGFELGSAHARELAKQAERARHYQSRHHYSMRALGLSHQRILADFGDVFERYDFDRREETIVHGAVPS
jgi:hypothetical protein